MLTDDLKSIDKSAGPLPKNSVESILKFSRVLWNMDQPDQL